MKQKLILFFIAAIHVMFAGFALGGNGINMHSGVVYTCSANFYDGGGPNNDYVNNQQDTLTIYPPANLPNSKICITFHKFSTEETTDYLRVYNGNSVAAPLIREMSGGVKYGTIKSSANDGSITLLFHSNNTNIDEGWRASITVDTLPEDITMIASGKWYSSGGRFFDSGGPNNDYENNATNVITTIYPNNPSDKISVIFHDCNLNYGDALTIFNGSTPGVNQIGTITGYDKNFGTITSSAADGSLTFVFSSNASGTAPGWAASIVVNYHPEDITTIANGTFLMDRGRFFDSGGSLADYPDFANTTITTILPKTAGSFISVTFHECNIAFGDYLEVYDAATATGTPIATITSISTGTIHASNSSGGLTFRFVTNASGNAPGWIASITTFNSVEEITLLANQSFVVNCFARFYDSGGVNFNYTDNNNVVTTLIPSGPTDKLNVNFHSFNLSFNDFLYIYNGPDTNATLLGSYTGNLNAFSLSSTHSSGSLTFKLVSGSNGNSYGWTATVTCNTNASSYNMPLNTTASYTTSGAYFFDNGGPDANYDNNSGLNSTVTFFPTNSSDKISVSFTGFSTYSDLDYLEVYDGDNIFTAPLIAKLFNRSGYGTIKASNTQGCLTFRFISDAGATSDGWAAYISTTTQPQIVSLPGTYITDSGFFMDAGGNGGSYANQSDYTYTFTPTSNQKKIGLSFTFIDTYNVYDFLEVHDGVSITDPIIAVLTENAGYGTVRASASNPTGSLTVRFISDNGAAIAGWAATIGTDSLQEVISLPGTYTINEPKSYYDQGGPFGNYTDNINTTTYLRPANTGDKISIMLTKFGLYNNFDYIEIHDGPSATDPIISLLGTNIGYGTITSTHPTGCLTIKTISDNGATIFGWAGIVSTSAPKKIISMQGIYTTDNGIIMDNGGPDINYNNNDNSVVTIYPTQPNSYTSINFNYLEVYNVFDSILIYNGNSTTAPLLGILNSNTFDTTFTSTATDGSLTLKVSTDNGATRSGWAAAISTDANCFYTGIDNPKDLAESIQVYPNPASNEIQVDLSYFANENIKLELYDIAGNLLKMIDARNEMMVIPINFKPGIYLIKISGKEKVVTKKLIIK